jgi:hypothetical protein
MKIALHILPGIVMLCVALSFALVYVNTHPPRSSARIHPSDLGVSYASVEFPTEDGHHDGRSDGSVRRCYRRQRFFQPAGPDP